MNAITLNIDRIILKGLDVNSDRARLLKPMIEQELQKMFINEGISDHLTNTEIPSIQGGVINIQNMHSDRLLARNIARRIITNFPNRT